MIINGRTQERVDEALKQLHGNVVGIAADLGTAAGVDETIARFPDVDILVNNLGIFEVRKFEEIDDRDWTALFRSQRDERRAVEPSLSATDEAA